MAILIPVLSRAREQGRIVVCRSNLRTLAFGAMMWSENNDGWVNPCSWPWPDPMQIREYPEEHNPGSLRKEIAGDRTVKGSVLVCPSAKSATFLNPLEKGMGEQDKCTYSINGWMTTYVGDEVGDKGPGDVAEGPDWAGPGFIYWKHRGNTKLINVRKPRDTVYFMDHEYYLATPWSFDPLKPPTDLNLEWMSA